MLDCVPNALRHDKRISQTMRTKHPPRHNVRIRRNLMHDFGNMRAMTNQYISSETLSIASFPHRATITAAIAVAKPP